MPTFQEGLTWRGYVHAAYAVTGPPARLPLSTLCLPGEVGGELMVQQL